MFPRMKKHAKLALCGIVLSAAISPVTAEELSADLAALGNMPFGAGNLLPPGGSAIGTRLLQYNFNKIADQNGNMRTPLTALNATAQGTAITFAHMTELKAFGADYGMQVILPYLDISASSTLALGPRTIHSEGHFGEFANLTISPVMLAWRDPSRTFNQNFILDIQLPIGTYQSTNPLNAAADAYIIRPKYTFTHMTSGGFETTMSFSLDYNFKNRNEDYKTGSIVAINAALGQHFGAYTVGLSGYALQQLEDDQSKGATAPFDGSKAKVFALGPSVSYRDPTQKMAPIINLKYLSEFSARNRSEGNSFWLVMAYPF